MAELGTSSPTIVSDYTLSDVEDSVTSEDQRSEDSVPSLSCKPNIIQKQPRLHPSKKGNGKDTSITPVKVPSSMKKPAFDSAVKRPPIWQNFMQALALFFACHGNFNVPPNYIDPVTGLRLGAWVTTVRKEYAAKLKNPTRRSQLLSTRRQAILEAMGFTWSPSLQSESSIMALPASWEEEFLQAKAGSNAQFVTWANDQIQLMRAHGGVRRDAPSTFTKYWVSFRISLLELAVEEACSTNARQVD